MTEIEKKALALLNEVRASHGLTPYENLYATPAAIEALCRAIEQHEAFRQEVSDALEYFMDGPVGLGTARERLGRFIIAKPDPLVEAWQMAFPGNHIEDSRDECAKIIAAIEARGGRIVWEGE